MISHQRRFIFIQVPRTAGTSVTAALRDESCELLPDTHDPRVPHAPANHLTLHEINRHGLVEPEVLRSYFKLCFVRNPWDWMISEICCPGLRPLFDGLTVEQSIRKACAIARDSPVGYGNHLRPQSDFIASGDLEVDFVGRFEDLADDFRAACERIGRPANLPALNRTQHTSYWSYYNRETRDLVAETFRRDIERFGYAFAAD